MRVRSTVCSVVALAAFAFLPPRALAQVTLDFENLSNPINGTDINAHGNSVTQNGFTVTATTGRNGLVSIVPNASTFGENYTGSVALLNNRNGGITTLTQNNGNSFTLNSIDIADLDLTSSLPYRKMG